MSNLLERITEDRLYIERLEALVEKLMEQLRELRDAGNDD